MTKETNAEMTLGRRLRAWPAPLRRLTLEKAGTSMFLVAFAMPVVLAMAGLGLDVTMWYLDRRENQTLADNIALAATMELNRDNNVTDATLENLALEEAKRAGYTEDGTTFNIAVNRPPLIGPNAGDDQFVEIVVSEQRPLFFAEFVMDGPVTVESRSVGAINTFGEHCVLALHESMDDAIEVQGTADANIGCGVASNSSSEKAIGIYGNATLTADPAQVFGDIYDPNNGLVTNSPPQPLSERLDDPYVDLVNLIPKPSGGCNSGTDPKFDTVKGGTAASPVVLSPNWDPITSTGNLKQYCGGITILAGAYVHLDPGVYLLDEGDFKVSSGATVTGDGVTIIITAWEPSSSDKKTAYVGIVNITGGATLTLTAPTSGPFSGMLFIIDPRAPSTYSSGMISNDFTGGSTMNLTGAIYSPTREALFSGNNAPANGGSSCTQIVAAKVSLQGTSYLENDPAACSLAGVQMITQTRVRLVE